MASQGNFHTMWFLYTLTSMCEKRLYYHHKSKGHNHLYLTLFYMKTMKYQVFQLKMSERFSNMLRP